MKGGLIRKIITGESRKNGERERKKEKEWREKERKRKRKRELTFLIIITKKGSLIPNVCFGFAGQVRKVVLTFVPITSKTLLWMSWSVIRLICPLRTIQR